MLGSRSAQRHRPRAMSWGGGHHLGPRTSKPGSRTGPNLSLYLQNVKNRSSRMPPNPTLDWKTAPALRAVMKDTIQTPTHFFCWRFAPAFEKRNGAPLLQFWHHEVTDPSANSNPKPAFLGQLKPQKVKEPKPNPKGFPKGLGDLRTFHFA